MDDVVIKSSESSAMLLFKEAVGDTFVVAFESPWLTFRRMVWGYTDCEFLVQLFESMARDWRGWTGTLDWASFEDEFRLKASCDHLGHVTLEIECGACAVGEDWLAKASVRVEAGRLDKIAGDVRRFFG